MVDDILNKIINRSVLLLNEIHYRMMGLNDFASSVNNLLKYFQCHAFKALRAPINAFAV